MSSDDSPVSRCCSITADLVEDFYGNEIASTSWMDEIDSYSIWPGLPMFPFIEPQHKYATVFLIFLLNCSV